MNARATIDFRQDELQLLLRLLGNAYRANPSDKAVAALETKLDLALMSIEAENTEEPHP